MYESYNPSPLSSWTYTNNGSIKLCLIIYIFIFYKNIKFLKFYSFLKFYNSKQVCYSTSMYSIYNGRHTWPAVNCSQYYVWIVSLSRFPWLKKTQQLDLPIRFYEFSYLSQGNHLTPTILQRIHGEKIGTFEPLRIFYWNVFYWTSMGREY